MQLLRLNEDIKMMQSIILKLEMEFAVGLLSQADFDEAIEEAKETLRVLEAKRDALMN